MPVLLGTIGGEAGEFEVHANASATSVVSSTSGTELLADTSADSLLDSTSVTGLLRAGARADAADAFGAVERFFGATASTGSGLEEEAVGDAAATFEPLTTDEGTELDAPESSSDDPAEPDDPSSDGRSSGDAASGDAASGDPAETTSADGGSKDSTSGGSESESRPEPTIPPASAPTTPPPPTPTAPAPPAPAEPPAPAAAPDPPSGEPTAMQWATLRQCEAWGNYTVVSGNGRYFGAYQFSQGTWDNIARASARSDLVGVRPSDASPADQDALALSLWRTGGWSSWPSCGKKAAVA